MHSSNAQLVQGASGNHGGKSEHDRVDEACDMFPEWLREQEAYSPLKDKDTFIEKSILTLIQLISKIKMQEGSKQTFNMSFRILEIMLMILLLSMTKSFGFVRIVGVYLLVVLSTLEGRTIMRVIRISLSMTLITGIVMMPSLWMGSSYSAVMITSKVFCTVTLMAWLSQTSKWHEITGALRRFHFPELFIFILDIAIKYMYLLGEFALEMFYALKMRSVGRNSKKYTSLAGIAGTLFLRSGEMAEEMHQAMICRGYTGEYSALKSKGMGVKDYIYLVITIGFFGLFFYLS